MTADYIAALPRKRMGAGALFSDLLARRLGAALQARKKGTTTYLENGHPIA